MLQTRKHQVTLVSKNNEQTITMPEEDLARGIEIEQLIVDEVIKRHEVFIKSK